MGIKVASFKKTNKGKKKEERPILKLKQRVEKSR